MLTGKISCPHCSTTLKTNGMDLQGRRIKCQTCGQKFQVGTENGIPNADHAVPVAAPFAPPQGTLELPAVSLKADETAAPKKSTIQIAAPHSPPPNPVPTSTPPATNRRTTVLLVPTAEPFAPPPAKSHRSLALNGAIALGLLLLLGGSGALGVYFLLNPGDTNQDQGQTANLNGTQPLDYEYTLPPDTGELPGLKFPSELGDSEPSEPKAAPPGVPPTTPEPKKDKAPTADSPAKKKPANKNIYGDEIPTLFAKKGVKSAEEHRTSLSEANQKKVNEAIEKGVRYLKQTQGPDGSWGGGKWAVGYTALPALTLLECDVPASDPAIQKAAAYVRQRVQALNTTYELSLAILFLDKLGDKNDQDLIRLLAMRLVAGQQVDGGWNYHCPLLGTPELKELLIYLHKTRPDPVIIVAQKENPLVPIGKEPAGTDLVPLPGSKGDGSIIPVGGNNQPPAKGNQQEGGILLPFPDGEPVKKLKKEPPPGQQPPAASREPAFKPFNIKELKSPVQKLPIVQINPFPKSSGRKQPMKAGPSDNSNTQFAIMALWVARKYQVPVEKVMALVDHRFLSSQHNDGTWTYRYLGGHKNAAMICVGLMGLAVGHGSHKESLGADWKKVSTASTKEDPAIQLGLSALANHIGEAPTDWNQNVPQANLYFLWSVERVAMLYNLKTIGKKDWYSWAAQMLVVNQHADGSWRGGGYHGNSPAIDTCLALLILRRANFVPDLTESLREYIPIRD